MDWIGTVSGISAIVVTVGGLVVSWRRARSDREVGVSTVEQTNRRDTVADRDALIDQIQEEQINLRARLSSLEHEHQLEREWNRALVDHIYRQLPPPPPARPTRPKP